MDPPGCAGSNEGAAGEGALSGGPPADPGPASLQPLVEMK